MNNPMYNNAKTFIKRKFIDLKNKIISNFKEGFIKKDIIVINVSYVLFRMSFLFVKNMNFLMRYQITITRRHSKRPRRWLKLRVSRLTLR